MCTSKGEKDIYSILHIPDVKSQHKYEDKERLWSVNTNESEAEKFDRNTPSGSIFDNYNNYPPEPDNYWQKFRITTIIGIVTVIAPVLWFGIRPLIDFHSHKSTQYLSEETFEELENDNVPEELVGNVSQVIRNSTSMVIEGHSYHFYKGYFIYKTKSYPVKIAFAEKNGSLTEAYYKNVNYGAEMTLDVQDNGVELKLIDYNGFEICLNDLDGDEILGRATNEDTTLKVRLTPTNEIFDFTPVSHSSTKGLPIKGMAAGDYPDYTIKTDNDWIEAAVPEIDSSDGIVLNGYGYINHSDISVNIILLSNGHVVGRYHHSNGTKLDLNGYVDPSSGNLYIKLGHAYDSTESQWTLRPISTDEDQGKYIYVGEWGKSHKPSKLTLSY